MQKRHFKWRGWNGIDRSVSERDQGNALYDAQNVDTDVRRGSVTLRKGYSSVASATTTDLDRIYSYRDEAWNKDVVLAYDKDSTAANRAIVVYTQTAGAGGTYTKGSSYSYGSLRFGDNLSFLYHRGGVRIGTGTATTNKALFAGYIDRSTASGKAMFDDEIAFNDFFLTKQQFVQQDSLISQKNSNVVWDSDRERYYVLTEFGLEIRDSDFYLLRVLGDIQTHNQTHSTVSYQYGGVAVLGAKLYAVGQVPGGTNTSLIVYDIEDDYAISDSATKSSPDFYHYIATDGSTLYVTVDDGANGYVAEVNTSTLAETNRYTGDDGIAGLTTDGTYVYVMDPVNQQIVRMLKASPYTASTYSHSLTFGISIVHYGGTLYYTGISGDTGLYSTATSTFNSKTDELTLTGVDYTIGLDENNDLILGGGAGGRHWLVDESTLAVQGYWPSKLAVRVDNLASGTPDVTAFYGISVIDIYGQEHHLLRGARTSADADDWDVEVIVYVNADSEKYAEQTSPSSDPTATNSIWNEFRRIDKIRVYRAYSSSLTAQQPETTYRFLKEIDINDAQWLENVNNERYSFSFRDKTEEADMSTVTFEESSGIQESFKPYYTNWQHAARQGDLFYFGNCRTDELQSQLIIESAPNSPDVLYQQPTNIGFFDVDDGDEITGMSGVWNRLVVFKSTKSGIFNGLEKEFVYDIGMNEFGGYIAHNNTVLFYSNKGIYRLTTNGYQRISQPVDDLINLRTVTGVSTAIYKKFNKILFHLKNDRTYVLNLNDGTWNKYVLASTGNAINYVHNGVDEKVLLATAEGDIHEFGNSVTDDGNQISMSLTTPEYELGDGYLDVQLYRVFLTHALPETDTLTLSVKVKNRNGLTTINKTMPETIDSFADVLTTSRFLSGAFGHAVQFDMSATVLPTDAGLFQCIIDSVGLEAGINVQSRVVGEV